MITPADRAEKSAKDQTERLERIILELQKQSDESKKDAERADKYGKAAFFISIASVAATIIIGLLK